MNIYLDMFITFAKVGAFTFGGGYAMLPMLQSEVVDKKKWADDDELLDFFAVGQCTPGVIAHPFVSAPHFVSVTPSMGDCFQF